MNKLGLGFKKYNMWIRLKDLLQIREAREGHSDISDKRRQ